MYEETVPMTFTVQGCSFEVKKKKMLYFDIFKVCNELWKNWDRIL